MKTQLLSFCFLIASSSLFAQNIFFRSDAGVGAALSFGQNNAYGIAAFAEPKLFINPQVSLGLRFEGDVLFGGKISSDGQTVDVGLSTRAALLFKGEYYLSENDNRPFFGLGFGRYTIANTSAGGNGSATITAAPNNFGFAPEIGMAFGNFRISGMYHFVMGKDIMTLTNGETREIPRNYISITLGFRAFGINDN